MKRAFLLIVIFSIMHLTACVYDSMFCIPITNHTNDTILIYTAQCNDIDSVKTGVSSDWFFELKFDETGKLFFDESNDIIFPDSCALYCEPGGFRNKSLFISNHDKKGYFFVIELETAKNYTWEEIRRNKLFETLIITRELLKENDWKIDFPAFRNVP